MNKRPKKRMPKRVRDRRKSAAEIAVALLLVLSLSPLSAVTVGSMPLSRYQGILERAPFGPLPPPEKTAEEIAAEEAAAAAAAAEEAVEIIPEGLDKIKVTMLTTFRGLPSAGFVDGTDGKSYLLHEGEQFESILCKEINLEDQTVTLVRGGVSAELPLWINPATTNCADVTTFGQPGGKPAVLPTGTEWEMDAAREKAKAEQESRREAMRKRREEKEAERKRFQEEMAKLTPEERDRRMRDINLNLIREGNAPPLPIELDEEDVRRLEEEGFDIPEDIRENAREETERNRRHFQRGPWRGNRRGRGAPSSGTPPAGTVEKEVQ